MNKYNKLQKLQKVSAVIREHKLSELAKALAECTQTRSDIQAIEQNNKINSFFSVDAKIAQEYYAIKQMHKKRELNQKLALQMADLQEARGKAQHANGRHQMLKKITNT